MAAFESKKFSWRKGYSYRISADTVGSVLETIEQRDGEVTSKAFLEESRPEGSATHSMFEWDDSVAAELYRLRQAAQIINQLEVQVVCEESPVEEQRVEIVPAYVNTEPKTSPMVSARFQNVYAAMEDEESRRIVLANAMRELKAFKRKYATISTFAKLFAVIEDLDKELKENAS